MSNHDSFLNSNRFEIINNTFSEDDILINRLENEIYQKEQKQKDFADIYSKYEQMKNDISPLTELKNKLQKEFDSLLFQREKEIKEWQNKNEILIQELSKKNDINQKLYDKNNITYIEIERKEKENKKIEKHINNQELLLNNLNGDKNEIMRISRELSQKNELNQNNINYLKNEIETLNKKNEEVSNLLKLENENNINIIKQLKEEENINKEMILELKNKDKLINELKNELFKKNQILSGLKNEYSQANDVYQNNQKEIISLNDELIQEVTLNNEMTEKNRDLIDLINEREKKTYSFDEENEEYKKDIENYKNETNRINNELKVYKKHFEILNNINNKVSQELNYFIKRDSELSEEFQIVEHLKEIANRNNEMPYSSMISGI